MNKIYRLWLFEDWELEQQQAWLSDMAEEGWHVKQLSPLVVFTKGAPSRIRYRCDVAEENDEQIELYRAAGWEYVGRRRNVQIFRAKESTTVPEIYTDTSEQAYTLRLLTRGLWQNTVTLVGLILVLIFAYIISNSRAGMLLTTSWLHVLGSLFIVHLLWMSVKGLLHLARLRKRLVRGKPLISGSYKELRGRRRFIVPAIMIAALIVLTGNVQARITRLQQQNFPPIPTAEELAMPRLAEVLKQAGYMEYYPSQAGVFLRDQVGGDVFNYYRESASLMVPVQQEMREKLDVLGVSWDDGTTYSPIMQVSRYEARGNGLARQLAEGLAQRKADIFRLANLVEASLPGVDGYWQRSEGNVYSFILLKENVVISVYYHGLEPFEQVLKLHLDTILN